MELEIEIDENETEEGIVEQIAMLSFAECSRKDLEELGKFFLLAAQSLPTPEIGSREYQTSVMVLNHHYEHFSDYETSISVSLGMHEP